MGDKSPRRVQSGALTLGVQKKIETRRDDHEMLLQLIQTAGGIHDFKRLAGLLEEFDELRTKQCEEEVKERTIQQNTTCNLKCPIGINGG